MMNWLRKNYSFVVVCTIFLLVKFFLLDTYFFWDSLVILSRPATYLYENGLTALPFPQELGVAPTFLHFYTALVWTLFGRTSLVTHLSFLPFILLLLFQIYKLCKRFVGKDFLLMTFLFVVSDPTFVAQTLGLYADLFLMAFAICSINNILENNRLRLIVSLFLLAAVGERGMLMAIALTILYFFIEFRKEHNFLFSLRSTFYVFLPTFFCLISFVVYQKITTGYLLLDNSENSDWGMHWRLVDFRQFMKNCLALGFRFVEYGRLFLWITFVYLLIKVRKKAMEPFLFSAYCIIFVVLLVATLPWYNPFGMRYFLLLYLLFALNLARSISISLSKKKAKTLLFALILLLSCSHFYVYPERLSQSWDSSLAHLPYFDLRRQTIDFLKENNVPFSEVGVSFPLTEKHKLTDFSDENGEFSNYDFKQNRWIIYTNIGNLDTPTIDLIRRQTLVKRFEKCGVFFELYRVEQPKKE
ncbi:MAG: hypothetical protein J6Q47_03115 [Paludibacteraceae bacterium]|nr:hypothetical protein [Paludibacteraceae bacterium]